MATWTQAICEECYQKRRPGWRPYRLKKPDEEICCDCGKKTKSGIYYRENPNLVKYPRQEEDD